MIHLNIKMLHIYSNEKTIILKIKKVLHEPFFISEEEVKKIDLKKKYFQDIINWMTNALKVLKDEGIECNNFQYISGAYRIKVYADGKLQIKKLINDNKEWDVLEQPVVKFMFRI